MDTRSLTHVLHPEVGWLMCIMTACWSLKLPFQQLGQQGMRLEKKEVIRFTCAPKIKRQQFGDKSWHVVFAKTCTVFQRRVWLDISISQSLSQAESGTMIERTQLGLRGGD